MSTPRFEYRGDLATAPVPEALQTIHRYRVPGVMTVSRGGMAKRIFLWGGEVIFGTSTEREDSLGEFLVRRGTISREDHDRTVPLLLAAAGTKRHGEVLLEVGLVTAETLQEAVAEQVRSIVFSVFPWDEGTVTFQVGQYRTDEIIRLNLPTRRTVLEGVRSIVDVKPFVARLGPSWTVYSPSYAPADVEGLGLGNEELRFLQRVDGVKSLKELVMHGPADAAGNAGLLYAFHALKLISRREQTSPSGIRKIQWKTGGPEPPRE